MTGKAVGTPAAGPGGWTLLWPGHNSGRVLLLSRSLLVSATFSEAGALCNTSTAGPQPRWRATRPLPRQGLRTLTLGSGLRHSWLVSLPGA